MLNAKLKQAIAFRVGTEALKIIESGDPEHFILEVDGQDVEAINFWYCGQECDLYLIDPYIARQVEADKTFYSFQDLIEEINNGQTAIAA
jgi:hypothetical protein